MSFRSKAKPTGEEESPFEPSFAWKTPRGRRFRLAIFLSVALALHAILFYLFQVVYPPSRRLVRQPAGITLLTPTTPGALPILREVADRAPGFEGGLSDAGGIGAGSSFVADYVASYHGYAPELVKPDFKSLAKPLPLLAAPGSVVLPHRGEAPIPENSAETNPERALAKPRWILGGKLGGRNFLIPPSLENIDLELLATQDVLPRLRVGVAPSGEVVFTGMTAVSTSCPPELERQLRKAASRLRLVARDSEGVSFGWLMLGWKLDPNA